MARSPPRVKPLRTRTCRSIQAAKSAWMPRGGRPPCIERLVRRERQSACGRCYLERDRREQHNPEPHLALHAHCARQSCLTSNMYSTATLLSITNSRGRNVSTRMRHLPYVFSVQPPCTMGSHTQLAVSLRQLCWAHLKRDFQKHRELGGAARNTGLRTVHIMFVTVHHKGTKPTKNSLVAHVPTHEQQMSA